MRAPFTNNIISTPGWLYVCMPACMHARMHHACRYVIDVCITLLFRAGSPLACVDAFHKASALPKKSRIDHSKPVWTSIKGHHLGQATII